MQELALNLLAPDVAHQVIIPQRPLLGVHFHYRHEGPPDPLQAKRRPPYGAGVEDDVRRHILSAIILLPEQGPRNGQAEAEDDQDSPFCEAYQELRIFSPGPEARASCWLRMLHNLLPCEFLQAASKPSVADRGQGPGGNHRKSGRPKTRRIIDNNKRNIPGIGMNSYSSKKTPTS